ncbi:MAG: pyridoxal phosphate-dependent aminotransferase [Gemmatimonadetes bacterium]|nr:pyridoxal phosphate-dependent aminotransferase [Gemmatimonadota bacterium]MDE3256886.1 pyridoxal phosphate-dependent aminotransferase [Gemmatimonadota bacterium]
MPHEIPLAATLSNVEPSRIRELADVAFAMDGVYKMHFGESDLPTPRYIKDAAVQALDEGYTFYTENAGLPGLREALAARYAEIHGVTLVPGEILITASGVQALNVSIRCVIDPGDEAIVLTPNWPNAAAIVNLYGGNAVEIPFVKDGDRHTIDFAVLESALSRKTKLLAFTSPSNPMGWVASLDEQQKLLDFCRCNDLWLLADEVYEHIYYNGPVAPSILRLCDRNDAVIVVQSFSKTYRMTGWRLGWVVSRPDLVDRAAQLNEFIVSHAPAMVQRAGEIALRHGESNIHDMVDTYHKRISFCYDALNSTDGVSVSPPDGAFYLFPSIEGVSDSFAFALELLNRQRVSVAPGIAFGEGGEGSVRLCCASDPSVLEPAMEHFCRYVEQR